MSDFDSFAIYLLEEAKALLDKANVEDEFSQMTYLHASLLLSISALEACINAITDELLVDPYKDKYTIHEQGLLLEKDVHFDKGGFSLGKGLKISRMTDRIEFLYKKFSGNTLDTSFQWYMNLKQGIDLRNKLVHPKEYVQLTFRQVEQANLAVISTINELYKVIYKRKLPTVDRGLTPKQNLV